jgi:hypothetical protein
MVRDTFTSVPLSFRTGSVILPRSGYRARGLSSQVLFVICNGASTVARMELGERCAGEVGQGQLHQRDATHRSL